MLCDQEDYTAVISAFEEAIRLDPNNRDAHNNRGNVKFLLRRSICFLMSSVP